METAIIPPYVDAFVSVVRDNQVAQVAVLAVLLLIVLDWLFGIANALMHQEFDSAKMREGLGHKCAELGVLLVGLIMDGALLGGFDLGYSAPVLTVLCAYICIMEIGSLLEIFAEMNPQLADSGPMRLLASTGNAAAEGLHAKAAGERDEP